MKKKATRSKGAGRFGALLFLAVVYLTQSGYDSCTGDLLHDSGFDMWCGDQLCSWKVERGEANQAPTWHESDLGVALVGDDVLISQRTDIDDGIAPCVRFELVADIAEDASVTLQMDLFGDGEIDYERQLPTSSWAPLVYVVHMPLRYQGILFRLAKTGGGRAVLAQIRARTLSLDECGGATAIDDLPVPLGGSCYSRDQDDPFAPDDAACESGECAIARPAAFLPYSCSECQDDAGCGEGEVCGLAARVPPFLDPYRACVAAASRSMGELCMADGECATGICCQGWCASCCADDGRECAGGATCSALIDESGARAPDQCDAGQGHGQSGEACLRDDDCASGACAGGEPLRVCPVDGRLCDDDPDCPPDAVDEGEGREIGRCVVLGTSGGSCQ